MADIVNATRKVDLKTKLDKIDSKTEKGAYDGFYESRLCILMGQWEKGQAVSKDVTCRGVNVTDAEANYLQLEKETGRSRQHLKKWHTLYLSYPDKAKYLPLAEEKARVWTGKLFAQTQLPEPTPELPEGTFNVIYADPPWEYSNAGLGGAAEKHYPTMATEKICEMGICGIAAENAVLFLWATNPLLTDALQVMKAWGFAYKTNFCWVKGGRGTYGKLGFYVSGAHELLLLGTRGSMLPDDEKPSSVITEPKSKHSQKPESVYGIIEQMYGNGKRLELFARNAKPRKSWTYWGNEA